MDQRLQRHPAVSDVENVCLCLEKKFAVPCRVLWGPTEVAPRRKEETMIGQSRTAAPPDWLPLGSEGPETFRILPWSPKVAPYFRWRM